MAHRERINRDRPEEREEESRHKKKAHQPLHDQFKATDEGVVPAIDFQAGSSLDAHTAMLASASSAQRANLVIQLQQAYGNAYVQRLLNSRVVQAKLTVNPPDDVYEREADRVADAVMQVSQVQRQAEEEEEEEEVMTKPASQIQRQAEEEEEEIMPKPASELQRQVEEEEEEVMPKPVSQVQQQAIVAEELETQINAARGSGQPLDDSMRASLEPEFGRDFSQVRIHTDAKADVLSRELGAKAFTTGDDVFFREGAYHPESEDGKKLIAHELTHVVQQKEAEPVIQGQKATAEAPAAAGLGEARLAALKVMFEATVVTPLRNAYEALGEEKPDAKLAYSNVRNAYEVVKSMLAPYKGVEPMWSRLMAVGNAILTIGDMLEPHIGITRPLSEIRANLNPDGEVMSKYLELIRSQL